MNVIYARFSPRPADSAERSESIELQLEVCQRYAAMRDIAIDAVLQDPEVSARATYLFDRPAGQELRGLPKGSSVIAMKLDRVFRDTRDGLNVMDHWQETGVKLHLADQGGCAIDTTTATGKFLTTILLAQASFEPALISERTSKAMLRNYEKGITTQAPANISFGFKPDPNATTHMASGHSTAMIEDEDEQQVVNYILELHASGTKPYTIAKTLNNSGIENRGKSWFPVSVLRVIERHSGTVTSQP